MTNHLTITIHRWLSLLDVEVNKRYLSNRLLSHPNYPTALSITSLLDDMTIENGVAQIDKKELTEIPIPFLALVDNENFEIVTDINKIESSIENFWQRWNGIVIAAVKPDEIIIPKESLQADITDRNTKIKWALVFMVIGLWATFTLVESNVNESILSLLNLGGALLCSLIVLQELGINTIVSNHICSAEGTDGCNAILNSDASTLPFGVKVSDIGLSFFSGNLLLLWMAKLFDKSLHDALFLFITVVLFASIPMILASIFYQWRIAKQGCKLCLSVIAILVLMIVTVSYRTPLVFPINFLNTIPVISVFVLPGTVWLLIRNTLNNEKEKSIENIVLQRFYRSPELLEGLLLNQAKVDSTPWPLDFQLGNKEAPCQIIVVSSHFCGPCLETHEQLNEFLKKYKNQFGITVRFLANHNSAKKVELTKHMLQYVLSDKQILDDPLQLNEIINFWYKTMDIDLFKKKYRVEKEIDVESIIDEQMNWYRSVRIVNTPTIFINGYRLNFPYVASDLLELGDTLLEMFTDETELVDEPA